MRIFIAEPAETHPKAIERLKSKGYTTITTLTKNDELTIDALLVRTLTSVDAVYLSRFPKLQYVMRVGVGLDNIDLEECKRRNIKVINAPGSNANAVAEYVVSLMISASRNLIVQSDRLRKGQWRDMHLAGLEMRGKTIGIVGCGAIGKLVAKKLSGFEVESILGYDPFLDTNTLATFGIQKTDLEPLLKKSDYITLHLPLMKETNHMIARKQFEMMKPDTILINTSRGGIIDEIDLIDAIESKRIRGAAIDVFENEPHIRKELLAIHNLIVTPHIAALTREADEQMATDPVEAFIKVVQS